MVFLYYFYWHYTYGLKAAAFDVFELTFSLLDFFSVAHLIKTLFYPWHKIVEPYKRGFAVKEFVWSLANNLISRILGAIVRTMAILIGLSLSLSVLFFGILLLIFWISLPVSLPLALLVGAALLL